MAEDTPQPPDIAISRASTESRASSTRSGQQPVQAKTPPPRVNTDHSAVISNGSFWNRRKHAESWRRNHGPDVEWHIRWTPGCFPNGRVLIIDYISQEATQTMSPSSSGKRHIVTAAQEFQDLKGLQGFYADPRRAHQAALRVIHVQNATWATHFLLKKFNIDHPSDIVGMQAFSRWARYEKPRQRNGKPFPNGRAFREQTDPWRNISRTAFGLDYLKSYPTPPPNKRKRRATTFGERPIEAKMMHLNAYEDSRNPYGYDVSVQRLSVYVQRALGPPGRVSPDVEVKNPYAKQTPNGHPSGRGEQGERVELESLDNTNTVIVFETSASLMLEDCLIQPRNDIERRWRRLSFYLKREEAINDARVAAQCTNMILTDVFHGLGVVWEQFLMAGGDHVNILQDKIYENPADESRAPELWTNQAAWLKVEKVMWIHQDLAKEMQGHMRTLAEVDDEESPIQPPEWLASTPAEYERLGHSVQEDLVQPTEALSDLMYKSVGIRDSRQSLQLGLSMWRLSWITFIFLPLTFMVSFFGMNVNWFDPPTDVGWWFLASVILMLFVLLAWYGVKHSLQRRRQTPYQRGMYENLFDQLEDEYPLLWSSSGAAEDVEPAGPVSRIKWRLLKRWFAPEKTVNKKLYSSLTPDGDDAELGAWASLKRYLLLRWLRDIYAERRSEDAVAMAELGSRTSIHSIRSEPATINELAKASTPLAAAEAAPTALQQMHHISTYGLRPLNLAERRNSSAGTPRASSEERPSSRGSSGIMIEERNLSDSESEAGEGASDHLGIEQRGRM